MTVAVVSEVTTGAWNTVKATSADTGSDVVGNVVDVQLT